MVAGDKIVCVNLDTLYGKIKFLTLGKVYTIYNKTDKYTSKFLFIDDDNNQPYHLGESYFELYFKPLTEIREEKLIKYYNDIRRC